MLVKQSYAKRRQSRLFALWALCLGFCLVLSQALWLLHRVAHFDTVAQASVTAKSTPPAKSGNLWAEAFLPDHLDERSCAQYDQLGHADMAPGCPAMDLTQAATALALATHVASLMAAQAAGFLARGPPAIA
jgi:hypothetical protein